MKKYSLFVLAVMSLGFLIANAEDSFQSAQNQAKNIIDQGKRARGGSLSSEKIAEVARAQPVMLQCSEAFPMELLAKQGKDWRAVNSPALKDQDGNQVKTAVYTGQNKYGATRAHNFICLMNRWLLLSESGDDPYERLFPQAVWLNGQDGGYFLFSNKEYWGVRMTDIEKVKNGELLSSRTWFRANPEFASMLVVDFPKGVDRNEARVVEALEAMRGANLLGRTPYEDQKIRSGVGKIVASKLRNLSKDRDIHVKLFKSIAENANDIGLIWDEIDGAIRMPIDIKEVRAASQ